jgi:hypothetical protein
MHPVRLRCENSEYPDIPAFSRLVDRALHRPKLPICFLVSPKSLDTDLKGGQPAVMPDELIPLT